jgi:1,4-dihydroxy-2-naphthoate octaprenyltransferase
MAAGICVTAGQILASGKLPPLQIGILGFICGFALSSAALILNDYFDYEVDLINHPDRPLPSGAVSRSEVIGLTAVTTLVGLSAALLLGFSALLLVYFSIKLLKSQTPETIRQAMRGAYLGQHWGLLLLSLGDLSAKFIYIYSPTQPKSALQMESAFSYFLCSKPLPPA